MLRERILRLRKKAETTTTTTAGRLSPPLLIGEKQASERSEMTEQRNTYALVVTRDPESGRRGIGRIRGGVGGEAFFPLYSSRTAAEAHALLKGPEQHYVVEGGPGTRRT